MHFIFRKFLYLVLIISLISPISIGRAARLYQTDSGNGQAQSLLDRLTPEERVGQLFLMTFTGPEAAMASSTGAKIYDLIVNYHVGGVILQANNDNFVGSDQT